MIHKYSSIHHRFVLIVQSLKANALVARFSQDARAPLNSFDSHIILGGKTIADKRGQDKIANKLCKG